MEPDEPQSSSHTPLPSKMKKSCPKTRTTSPQRISRFLIQCWILPLVADNNSNGGKKWSVCSSGNGLNVASMSHKIKIKEFFKDVYFLYFWNEWIFFELITHFWGDFSDQSTLSLTCAHRRPILKKKRNTRWGTPPPPHPPTNNQWRTYTMRKSDLWRWVSCTHTEKWNAHLHNTHTHTVISSRFTHTHTHKNIPAAVCAPPHPTET